VPVSKTRAGRRNTRQAGWGILIALVVVVATGCAPTPVKGAPSPTPTSIPPTKDPETPVPVGLAPLTGHSVNVGALANPSIAAKIDNHTAARPQVGLEKTDIVFEELVEGGLTRYLAIWQSSIPAEIGPVRSIRPMDPDIVSSFGGIIAYSGGQERFVQLMKAAPVYNAIHGQADTESTFFRTPTKAAPHNVLVKAQEVIAQHSTLAAPVQQFAYSNYVIPSTAKRAGTLTPAITLKFSDVSARSWAWNDVQHAWLRSQDGAVDVDSAGAQLAATNVVVLRVGIDQSLGVPKTLLVGAGEAWVASEGGYVHSTWTKASATDHIVLTDDAGAPLLLAPGNTWVELVPAAGSVEFAAQ